MEIIEINNKFNNMVFPVLAGCICGGIMLYLFITVQISKTYKKRLEKAKRLIHEGYDRALRGRKDDGIFKENKRLRQDI